VLLHALPLNHVHGLVVAQHAALRAGATAVWVDRFDAAEVLGILASGRITIFMAVPTFYARFLQTPGDFDLSRVRLFTSGSAGLPAAVHEAFAARFGHRIVERYGMTEVGIVTSNPIGGERPGSIGLPLPGVRARIVDPEALADVPPGEVGELWIASPSVMSGYLGRPDATAEARRGEWMRTGDLGAADPDGYLRLVGRRSEMLITGGFNVYPAEVEAALLEHPGVREAAVCGLPDDDLGEVPAAGIVGEVHPDALRAFARERLAPYKVPRRIVVLDELPRNAMGKIVRRALAEKLTADG
jgi:malonyl-CoA/methylmalonyl-CoA synthetase